jgi:hypothetical protein
MHLNVSMAVNAKTANVNAHKDSAESDAFLMDGNAMQSNTGVVTPTVTAVVVRIQMAQLLKTQIAVRKAVARFPSIWRAILMQ